MKKVKTYVITVSNEFPKGHSNQGESTNFVYGICSFLKIHTIRLNYEFWKKRIEEVMKGNAVISLRYWTGKPYNSKQVEFFKLTKTDGVGFEKIQFTPEGILINDVMSKINHYTLAKNDGLNLSQFESWFKKHLPNSQPMAIIHFTSYRYINEIKVNI